MAQTRDLRMLTRYNVWANERLFGALCTLPPPALNEPRPGRHNGLIGVLGHMYVVDQIWKANLEGKEHGFASRSLEHQMTFDAIRRAQAAIDQWYVRFADEQTAESLEQAVDFRFVDGGPGNLRRDDMLLHVINHKTYHRGYVADMLYESGVRPPTIDLPVFFCGMRDPRCEGDAKRMKANARGCRRVERQACQAFWNFRWWVKNLTRAAVRTQGM